MDRSTTRRSLSRGVASCGGLCSGGKTSGGNAAQKIDIGACAHARSFAANAQSRPATDGTVACVRRDSGSDPATVACDPWAVSQVAPPAKMGLWLAVVRLAVTVRLYLHLLWINVNREATTMMFPPRPKGRLFRKVLIMGDGLASGVGDWVTMGSAAGPAKELQRLLNADPKVRCGVLGVLSLCQLVGSSGLTVRGTSF